MRGRWEQKAIQILSVEGQAARAARAGRAVEEEPNSCFSLSCPHPPLEAPPGCAIPPRWDAPV